MQFITLKSRTIYPSKMVKNRWKNSFQLGDYIPNSVYISQLFEDESKQVLNLFLNELHEHISLLNQLEKEKGLILPFSWRVDYQLINLKKQFNSVKNDLNYYKDLSTKNNSSGHNNTSGKSTRQLSAVCVQMILYIYNSLLTFLEPIRGHSSCIRESVAGKTKWIIQNV